MGAGGLGCLCVYKVGYFLVGWGCGRGMSYLESSMLNVGIKVEMLKASGQSSESPVRTTGAHRASVVGPLGI